MQASYASLPLAFEQNKGQTDAQVKYMARGNGYILFLTATDAVFSLRSPSAESTASDVRRAKQLRAKGLPAQRSAQKDSTAAVRMQLVGANSLAKISASGQLPGKSNYFIGNDPSNWQTDVAHYARVSYQDVYPGVNLAFHGAQRQTEFDFVVAPGANPAPIAFHFTGAQGMKTDDSGNLVISSAAGDVLLHKPFAYQKQNGERQPVDARFVLKANNQVSFELGNYDRSRELIIDPSVSIEYSTYLGGSGNDLGNAITFDSSGVYVTGETASQNFPGTSGGFTGTAQAFVTKIAANGSSLIYSTYIGGNGNPGDSGNAIAVDASGDAFVAGGTTSTNFPHTTGVFQTTLNGAGNAFVLELGPSGTLTYSTYLGGSTNTGGHPGRDAALGIALASDSSGDVYVGGSTTSTDFPTSPSPLQAYIIGSTGSGFLTKLNSSGTALVFSTYIGGSSLGFGDLVGAVAVNSSNNNAYVTGQTYSASFHTTPGVVQPTCGGCTSGNTTNAFVTVINPSGSAYVYSTFNGGNGIDAGTGIAVDSTGDAYVTGSTTSTNFPTTNTALQTTYGGGGSDAFVTKLNPTGSARAYSTYLGKSGSNQGVGIALDGSNNAYVTGSTNNSTDFPLVNPAQAAYGGGNTDVFVSELNSTGSALIFSTYLGGTGDDDSTPAGGIAVDGPGANIYVTGNTAPHTPGTLNTFPVESALQFSPGGGTDGFVVKYTTGPDFSISATTPTAVSPGASGTSTVTLTSFNSYASPVNLSCSVTGSGSPLPACSASSFSTNPVTPSATSALTITTTGASGAMFIPRNVFYAMWLPIAGMSLVGMAFSPTRSRRKKLLGVLMIGMVIAALSVMPACGGSGGGGGGGGSKGTPAGSYTVTITGTGTDASATTRTTQVTLVVN